VRYWSHANRNTCTSGYFAWQHARCARRYSNLPRVGIHAS